MSLVRALAVGLALTGAAALAKSAPKTWLALKPDERDQLIASQRSTSLQSRILANSARFLDTPYVHSPLGEGQGVDPDPRIRYDAVDCLTFVEHTIALSLAERPEAVAALLDEIRYGRDISYVGRNHLMEAQWLPANVAKGFIRNVTQALVPEQTEKFWKVLTAQSWESPTGRALGLGRRDRITGEMAFDGMKLARALDHLKKVPSGTLMLIVREDRPTKITRITHLGFIVQAQGRTYLRHASRDPFKRVVDEDVAKFLARNSRYDKWPVVGVSFWEVRERTAKVSTAKPP